MLGTFLVFLIYDQHPWWELRDEYLFGYIAPFFAAYVLYERWPKIQRFAAGEPILEVNSENRVTRWLEHLRIPIFLVALAMVLTGLAGFVLGGMWRALEGRNLGASHLFAYGYAVFALGVLYIFSSARAGDAAPVRERLHFTLLFVFPSLIWVLSVPPFSAVYAAVSGYLMHLVATTVFAVFDTLGYAVIQEGSHLKLPNGDVGVAEACSGIRSLTACLFAGSFLAAVFFESWWKKVFLVVASMAGAFFNNILRSLFLTGWAYAHGPESLGDHVVLFGMDLGSLHDFSGWFVLIFTVGQLFLLVQIFNFRIQFDDLEPVAVNEPAR